MATDESDRRLAAPGRLELVRDFVNTRDIGKGIDRIDEPRLLYSWVVERGLAPAGMTPTDEDVARARSLREALRAMLLANAGFPLEAAAVERFNAVAERVRLGVRSDVAGRFELAPVGEGLDRAIGCLLSAMFAAREDGTWPRLKACAECHWALYDRTKNRSATWCDQKKCGARARSRRYRKRRRGAPAREP